MPFRTATDTEVVLGSVAALGPDALERFRGMFAFARVRRAHAGLVARARPARHQAAVLPAVTDGRCRRLRVGAEGDLADPRRTSSTSTSRRSSRRCSTTGSPTSGARSRDVRKLPPGTWAEFRPNGTDRVHSTGRSPTSRQEAAAGPPADIGAVIEDSVAAHLVADVPVSTFLSGGLDSSIVTVLAKRHNPDRRVHDHVPARGPAARGDARRRGCTPARCAQQYGIALHEIEIAPDVVDLLPRIVDVLDEPIGDPAAINTLLICEAAARRRRQGAAVGHGCRRAVRRLSQAPRVRDAAARYQRLPQASAQGRGATRRRPAAGRCRRSRPAHRALGQAVHHVRGPAGGSGVPAQLHACTTRDDSRRCSGPTSRHFVDDVIDGTPRASTRTRRCPITSTACASRTRSCSSPGSTSRTPTGRAWRRPTEVRVPFVDVEVVRGRVLDPRRGKGSPAAPARSRSKRAAEQWLPKEIVLPTQSILRCTDLRSWISARPARARRRRARRRRARAARGCCARTHVGTSIEDERTGREDRAKQIWQLLSLELWYDHVRAVGSRV